MSPHPAAEPLIIVNGRVIDPASGHDGVADVAVEDGRVGAIGAKLDRSPAARVLDAEGCLVVPGLIDPHVHLREPGQTHKEDIASGTAAAVSGGFTTVCCMPNTSPAIDTPDMVRMITARARETAVCRVFVVSAGTQARKGERPAEIGLCANAGAVGISDDGDVIESAGVMKAVLAETARAGLAFMQHAQDPTLTRGAAMHAGTVSAKLGLGGWPREAEEIIVERDVRLNRSIGCRYHVQHVSSAGTVEILRRARAEGQPVSGEASPHHLLLAHEACDGYDTLAKMNPPLREQADADVLREGVADGTITILATDHAPHTAEEKSAPFADAPFGIIGLESALALYAEALVHTGAIDWPRLIELMTLESAKLCGLDARAGLGALTVGGPADVTVIDPDLTWTLTESELAGKSTNTPFLGRQLRGRAIAAIVAGSVRMERERAFARA
ncbi:MAG: dihydroorotase [Phycisphaeraceae bacterium]|nr:MAG: dihydroorotase [Phycisphaeraceae bacterium]